MNNFIRYIHGRVVARPYFILLPVSAFLLFFNLGHLSMWGDEFFTLKAIHLSVSEMIGFVGSDYHPPLYFLLAKAWCSVTGFTDVGLRSLSSLMGLLGIWVSLLVYRDNLTVNYYRVASLLLVIHPVLLLYFRMGRYYSALYLFSAISFYYFFRLLQSFGPKYFVPYIISGILLVYTSNTGWFVLAAQFIIWLTLYKNSVLSRKRYLGGLLLICIAYIPWFGKFFNQLTASTTAPVFHSGMGILSDVGMKFIYPVYSFFLSETVYPWNYILTVPAVIVIILAVVYLIKKGADRNFKEYRVISIIGLVVPVLIMAIVSLFVFKRLSFAFFPARLIFGILFVPMILSLGLLRLKSFFSISAIIVLSLFYIYANINYFKGRDFHNYSYNIPLKRAAGDFAETAADSEFVISNIYEPSFYFGGNHIFRNLKWIKREYKDSSYPSSLWFLIKNTGQVNFSEEAGVFIDSLTSAGEYKVLFTESYSPMGEYQRRVYEKLLGYKIKTHKLDLIHVSKMIH